MMPGVRAAAVILASVGFGLLVAAAQKPGVSRKERAKAKNAGRARPTEPVVGPATSSPSGPIRVAVLELGTLGMSNDERRSLEGLLRNSIATIDGFTMVPVVDLQMALSDPRNFAVAQCGGGPDCAVQVGRLVGADRVVFGTLSTIGDAFSLNLRVMDTKSGKELSREQTRTSGNRNGLIPEVRLAAFRLVAPDRIRAYLEIVSPVDGVEIEVNGRNMGVTPLPEPLAVAPGDLVIVARRPGFTEFQKELHVEPFERVKFQLELGRGSGEAR